MTLSKSLPVLSLLLPASNCPYAIVENRPVIREVVKKDSFIFMCRAR